MNYDVEQWTNNSYLDNIRKIKIYNWLSDINCEDFISQKIFIVIKMRLYKKETKQIVEKKQKK